MRSIIALALALLVSSGLFAQKNKRLNNKLLWRISGNGLTRPSYLFGTIHVQDKRAFDLNDSVIAKVIQCEAFALEMHPDSITQFVASVLLDQDKNRTLESQMSAREFAYYDSLMQKKTGLSLKKFKTIKEVKYFLQQRSMTKDKNTFLDAWLYNIARQNNKVMAGLESFRVQMKLLEDSTEITGFKEYLTSESGSGATSMKTLFDLYYEGDVDAIYNFTKANTSESQFRATLIDRNVDMTAHIIQEIHKHTIFLAVGAAHLGGELGIVNLLKQKGYTVTPVIAPFSGTASKYKGNDLMAKWFTFSSEFGYSVEMPNAPVPLTPPGMPFTFQTHLDIGTLTLYMAAHIPLGVSIEPQATSKALDGMLANMQNTHKISNVKKIMIDGHEGRELEALLEGHFFKMRFTIRQSNAYMLLVGPTKESANTPDAKRFLTSMKMTAPANTNIETADTEIERLVSKEGAFSVSLPGKVTKKSTNPVDPTTGRPVTINAFISADQTTGAGYIVRYNDFPVGYVSVDDSTYLHENLQAIYQKMAGVGLSTGSIDFQGYPFTHFSFTDAEGKIEVEGIMTLRGERFYMLMNSRAADENARQAAKAFLDSFRFIPFEKPALKEVSFPEGFVLKVPVTFESDSSIAHGADGLIQYAFVDRFSGMTFTTQVESFSKYAQAENAESFFSSAKENYVSDDWAVVKDSTIADKLPTHEYAIRSAKNTSIIRIRSVLAGDLLISLWAYIPAGDRDLILPDQIINSLRVTRTSDWSLFTDKTDLILEGISSADSTEKADARAALANHTFKDIHLPKIYAALKKNYDDDGEWFSTKGSLLNTLRKVNDGHTHAFIKEIYPNLPDTTLVKDRALAVLSSLKTRESVRSVVDLIAADRSGRLFKSYIIVNPLSDSLLLLNDVAVDLLTALPKYEDRSGLYRVIRMALDSNAFTPERRSQVIAQITGIASKLAASPVDTEGEERSAYEKYAVGEVLFSIPFTPQIQSIVQKFAEEDDDDLRFLCMRLLMKNNVTVATRDINLMASKPTKRLSLYEELLQYKKHHLIDKKYTGYRMLAESDLFEYLNTIDETPGKLDLRKEKDVTVNGEKRKILVYTYKYEGSDEKYIGVAGPYDIKSKEFKRGEFTASLYEPYTDDKDLDEKLSKFLSENNVELID